MRRRWNAAEIGILRQHYFEQGIHTAKHLPGRTYDAVSSEARKLGLRGPRKGRKQKSAVCSC